MSRRVPGRLRDTGRPKRHREHPRDQPRTGRGPQRRTGTPITAAGATPAIAGTTTPVRAGRRVRRDHPRVRGDHPPGWVLGAKSPGPPPRAWGPQVTQLFPGVVGGTTPACAGTTSPGRGRRGRGRDHPRVRGDHLADGLDHDALLGPPPRGRGPPPGRPRRHHDPGTTPACAGTTSCPGCDASAEEGPPPRARGPHHGGAPRARLMGTTPACAGTTWRRHSGGTTRRDHPRVRGDHRARSPTSSPNWGPPPRARGPPKQQ